MHRIDAKFLTDFKLNFFWEIVHDKCFGKSLNDLSHDSCRLGLILYFRPLT